MMYNEITKDLLSKKEIENLHPHFGLFNNVNFESIKYYKDNNGELYEDAICTDGTMEKNFNQLEKEVKKKELLNNLGL